MNKDRVDGAAKQAVGSVKEAAGKITHNTRLEVEGVAERAEGKVQSAIGAAKDALKS